MEDDAGGPSLLHGTTSETGPSEAATREVHRLEHHAKYTLWNPLQLVLHMPVL